MKKQVLVSSQIEGYKEQLWCDVVPMIACSLTLCCLEDHDNQIVI